MPAPPALAQRNREVRNVLVAILIANLTVLAVKFAVGIATRSLAVFGDAIHSSIDAVNNLFGLAFVGLAAKGPDAEHPYGHAKFETLGALVIVIFLSVSIFELVEGAVRRLVSGAAAPDVSFLALGLLVLTLAVNVVVVGYETSAGRRLHSELLLADAVHTRADVWVTVAVLAGLGLTRAGFTWADPVLALGVAALVGKAGYEIVRRSIPSLVDERALDEAAIRSEVEQVAGVRAAYAIRSRRAAHHHFAELTIAVDGTADVDTAHGIADQVEARLRDRLKLHEIVVHVEPC